MKYKFICLLLFVAVLLSGNNSLFAEETIIYLTRHGQTDWNVQRKWQGLEDTYLNLNGIRQAVDKGTFFSAMPIAGVYSSPLKRAHLTAQIIAAPHHEDVQVMYGLTEYYMGELQGMDADDAHAIINGPLMTMTQEERRRSGNLPGLLTTERVSALAEEELVKIGKLHVGEIAVAVSHSAIIESVLTMHTDMNPETLEMTNMAYLKFSYDGKNLRLIEISDDITYDTYPEQSHEKVLAPS